MPPSQSPSTRPQFSHKSQKLGGQKRVPLKFVKEDDKIKCENPQILEQPEESVLSQWKDQKMREFKLTVYELDKEIFKFKQQVS